MQLWLRQLLLTAAVALAEGAVTGPTAKGTCVETFSFQNSSDSPWLRDRLGIGSSWAQRWAPGMTWGSIPLSNIYCVKTKYS